MRFLICKLICFALVTATALLAGIVTGNSQTKSESLPDSMKGYELYSWYSEGRWNFVLKTGTNALPSIEGLMTSEDMVDGSWVYLRTNSIEGIKRHLRRLPQNANVGWRGKQILEQFHLKPGPLELPPDRIVGEIRSFCDRLGIYLSVMP